MNTKWHNAITQNNFIIFSNYKINLMSNINKSHHMQAVLKYNFRYYCNLYNKLHQTLQTWTPRSCWNTSLSGIVTQKPWDNMGCCYVTPILTQDESEGSINHPDEESKRRKQKPCTRVNQCSLPASAYYSAGGYKVVLNPDPIKDPPNNFSVVYNAWRNEPQHTHTHTVVSFK